MAKQFGLVIRGGTIVDGSGGAPFTGDIAISAGRIRAVGLVTQNGREEINATGKLVVPGFVDIHTHYDGQVTWEHRLKPSSEHGVTTVVMGNCGVGFAPCKPEERGILVKVMEGVEDIPEIVLTEGVPWKWQTFPEYLDFLSSRKFDADCAAYLPHAAVRVFVMGERAARREPATPEDCERMTEMVTEAVTAGAIGVSTSRLLSHRDSDGHLAPHVQMGKEEVLALARGLRNAGNGIFQIAASLANQQLKSVIPEAGLLTPEEAVRQEIALLSDICRVSGRPVTFSLSVINDLPNMFRQVLHLVAEANKQPGVNIIAQIFPRPIGMLFGLDLSLNPFKFHPSYNAIDHLPLVERVKEMRKPDVRARILSEQPDPDHPNPIQRFLVMRSLDAYPFGAEPDYEPDSASSLKAIAIKQGKTVYEVAYDALLQRDGKAILFFPINNFSDGSLDAISEMFASEATVFGLGDGGAHCGLICDASYPTFVLTYWVRDRQKGNGGRLTLPDAVNRLTRRNALAVGLNDRGLIAPGMKADVNIIDYGKLHLGAPEVVFDLPAGGRRVTQKSTGFEATIVNGEVTYRHGAPTGALPGRVIRASRLTHLPAERDEDERVSHLEQSRLGRRAKGPLG
jgi:N-acyl-D-amino-acid deacylase